MATVGLQCHEDIRVWNACIAWLRTQGGVLDVTPTLPVVDMPAAAAYYEAAGFHVHVYPGGGFAFVHHDEASVFDLGLVAEMVPSMNAPRHLRRGPPRRPRVPHT